MPESRIRIGVQLWPGGAPSYQTWRDAVLQTEDLGVDAIFGYDHFHKPFVSIVNGEPQLEAKSRRRGCSDPSRYRALSWQVVVGCGVEHCGQMRSYGAPCAGSAIPFKHTR